MNAKMPMESIITMSGICTALAKRAKKGGAEIIVFSESRRDTGDRVIACVILR